MSIATYSQILGALVLLLGTATFLSFLSYCFSPLTRTRVSAVSYTTWLKLIATIATMATLGAVTYQYVYATPVCVLCWWQRIFMFPIELILAVTLWTKTKMNHYIIGLMATIGLPISLYHYYGHYQKYVAGNPFLLPCSTNPLESSCSNSPIVTFGFITIPFMAAVVFATILWLTYLAYRKSQSQEGAEAL
jgi:disulfide bond formation protein DsbB